MNEPKISSAITYSLGTLADPVRDRLEEWEHQQYARRLWDKDHTLWSAEELPELTNRLGWLGLPSSTTPSRLQEIKEFAAELRPDTDQVVLLGMGGSSLAPEVFSSTFGNAPGFPPLIVLDSTHPAAIQALTTRIDPARTLFLVASKSGGTIETLSLFRFFWKEVSEASARPGDRFVALTDPGSGLETLAEERGFRRVFSTPPEVGGRYSALTSFGLVPAALIGMNIDGLMAWATDMASQCGPDRPSSANPGLVLGAALGEAARAGRDKATFLCSPALAGFGSWVEQLIAESTGKNGTGIVPVAGEPLGDPDSYQDDRLFVFLGLQGDHPPEWDNYRPGLRSNGHPLVEITLNDRYQLGAEIFRSEVAVASASSILGVNPFNQPDVQVAKDLARQAMSPAGLGGTIIEIAAPSPGLPQELKAWTDRIKPGDYLAIQAFLPMDGPATPALKALVKTLRHRFKAAVTLGFGPRFLHSTGQLHKGGANHGVFLQIVDHPSPDLDVPESGFGFGELIAGQAAGDFQALTGRDRRVLRVRLTDHPTQAIATLTELLALQSRSR
ncbi:MAG: hypothetical protein F4Y75_07705 [Acidimicrobiia bacterium]|nr:hypothetical protein [Acidimicrobiia bacterium]